MSVGAPRADRPDCEVEESEPIDRQAPGTLRVCWTGTFDPSFERNRRLRDYLVAAEVDYRVIRVDLWPPDRIDAFTGSRVRVLLRMMWFYPLLLARLLFAPAPDLYLVSYPGWFDVPVVKCVAWLKRRPVVFDIFISLHDTAVTDRRLASSDSSTARLSRFIDRLSMRLSRRVISDCPAHARFLAELADLPLERFGVVYVGADEGVFSPPDNGRVNPHLILFYGSFVPLQGVEWIVQAAALLQGRGYTFRIVGEGQEKARVTRVATESAASNVRFVEPMSKGALTREMANAALCLGIFGTSPKADRVIPHKVFEAIACGRPVLTGSTEAVRETFAPDEIAVCNVGDARDLADSITVLMEDESQRIALAHNGRARFERDFSLDPQARRLREELERARR